MNIIYFENRLFTSIKQEQTWEEGMETDVDEKLEIYLYLLINEPLTAVAKVIIVQSFSCKHIYWEIIGQWYKLDFLWPPSQKKAVDTQTCSFQRLHLSPQSLGMIDH